MLTWAYVCLAKTKNWENGFHFVFACVCDVMIFYYLAEAFGAVHK